MSCTEATDRVSLLTEASDRASSLTEASDRVSLLIERIRASGNRLRPRDVESLIDQASRLIDVASGERAELEQLSKGLLETERELAHLNSKVSDINAMRERLYTLKNAQIGAISTLSESSDSLRKQLAVINTATNTHNENLEKLIDVSADLAKNGMQHVWIAEYPSSTERKIAKTTYTSREFPIDELQSIGVRYMADHSANQQLLQLRASSYSTFAQLKAIDAQITLAKAEQEALDRDHKLSAESMEFLVVARKSLESELNDLGGLYNTFNYRKKELVSRISISLAYAHARMSAAFEGAKECYGKLLELPSLPAINDGLDAFITWIREAVSQLSMMHRNVQESVITGQLVPDGSGTSYAVKLEPDHYFDGGFVAVRGVSLTLPFGVSPDVNSVAYVIPPKWSFDKLQPNVRVCRILPWPSNWPADIYGASALYNWRLYGDEDWTVIGGDGIKGATLHIHVASIRREYVETT